MKIIFLIVLAFIITNAKSQDLAEIAEIQAAVSGISDALTWATALKNSEDPRSGIGPKYALDVCVEMYQGSKSRLDRLVMTPSSFNWDDAIAWLSGALAGNTACLDGLTETGLSPDTRVAQKLRILLEKALAMAVKHEGDGGAISPPPNQDGEGDNLATWEAGRSKADAVVAQDGSGQYKTINEALAAVGRGGAT